MSGPRHMPASVVAEILSSAVGPGESAADSEIVAPACKRSSGLLAPSPEGRANSCLADVVCGPDVGQADSAGRDVPAFVTPGETSRRPHQLADVLAQRASALRAFKNLRRSFPAYSEIETS